MKCRIMIEDENGLFQAEMEKDKSVQDVINNLRIILNMKKIGSYIILTDCANYNGCNCSFHGNAEKIAQQYDVLTKYLVQNNPDILMRVITAWERRKSND